MNNCRYCRHLGLDKLNGGLICDFHNKPVKFDNTCNSFIEANYQCIGYDENYTKCPKRKECKYWMGNAKYWEDVVNIFPDDCINSQYSYYQKI